VAIGAADVELLLVSGPGDGGASNLGTFVSGGFLIGWNGFWLDVQKWLTLLVHDVPDLDALVGGGGDELVLEVESEGVNLGLGLVFNVWLAQIIVVPNLEAVVLTTGDDVLSVEGEGQSVDVVVVGLDGGVALEVTGPDLKSAVSADGGIVLVLRRSTVSDLGNPLSVVEAALGLSLQLSLNVPQSQRLLVTSREDSAVVGGEADSLGFLLVADELSGALCVSEIPKSQSLVP